MRGHFLACVAAFSCTGNIGGSRPNDVLASPDDSVQAVCDPQATPPRLTAQRLTKAEYDNTLSTLFRFDLGKQSADFPEDSTGSNGLTVSDLFFAKHEEVSWNIADLVIARGFAACSGQTDKRACARAEITQLLPRAWRRPVTAAETSAVLKAMDRPYSQPGEPDAFKQSVRMGIVRTIMSPNFLHRFDFIPNPSSPLPQELGPYELANRLSYLVYGSMPDDELFQSAASGALNDPKERDSQLDRMLANEKAWYVVDQLADSITTYNRVDMLNPSAVFGTLSDTLRSSMKKETELLFRDFVDNNRDVRGLLDTDYTFVDSNLATHYGLPPPSAAGFNRVTLSNPRRRGVFTHASVLGATSVPHNVPTAVVDETSIITRGRFVLDNLLCKWLPSPPAELDIDKIGEEAAKMVPAGAPRKVREAVRLDPARPCVGCHTHIDPPGYAFEHFDVVGKWRDQDQGNTTVDSSGILTDATGTEMPFDGADSFMSILKSDPRFVACATRAVYHVGLGRKLNTSETCRATQTAARSTGTGLKDLLVTVTQDPAFLTQSGEAP